MGNTWHDFLVQQSAIFADGGLHHFGDAQQEAVIAYTQDIRSALTPLGMIQVEGADAGEFLQNQFTNDIKALAEVDSQLSAWCNPKGRMLAFFRVLRDGDRFFLLLPLQLLERIQKRLQMFVMRSDVILADVTDAWGVVGVVGKNAEQILSKTFSELPKEDDRATKSEETFMINLRSPENQARFLLVAPIETIQQHWKMLEPETTPVGTAAWHLLKIRSGMPSVKIPTYEMFIPQTVNLEEVGGLSFTKGCYPGQEVVARMQYLGKQKRKMFSVLIDGSKTPEVGGELFSPDSQSKQGAGNLVTFARNENGDWEGLAMLEVGIAEKGQVFLDAGQTVLMRVATIA